MVSGLANAIFRFSKKAKARDVRIVRAVWSGHFARDTNLCGQDFFILLAVTCDDSSNLAPAFGGGIGSRFWSALDIEGDPADAGRSIR